MQAEAHQIEGIELANQSQGKMARRAGMRGERKTHLSRFHRSCVLDKFLDGFWRQVATLQ
jgi:hypothetical protein